jgi:hypothetical protein
MDANPAVSADLVTVALDPPRSSPPPALSCHVTWTGPPPVGPVRSTPERTIPFFPKRRSVGPEPGRRVFIRIERTGRPAAARPVYSLFGPLSTSPTHLRSRADGLLVPASRSLKADLGLRVTPFARYDQIASRSSWKAHPRRPPARRLPARHAGLCLPRSQRLCRMRFAPPLRPPDTPCLAPSPSPTAFHPRVGTGNGSQPMLRVGPAIPSPTPHPSGTLHYMISYMIL